RKTISNFTPSPPPPVSASKTSSAPSPTPSTESLESLLRPRRLSELPQENKRDQICCVSQKVNLLQGLNCRSGRNQSIQFALYQEAGDNYQNQMPRHRNI